MKLYELLGTCQEQYEHVDKGLFKPNLKFKIKIWTDNKTYELDYQYYENIEYSLNLRDKEVKYWYFENLNELIVRIK